MQLNGKNSSNESVQFEKHQPERRRGIGGRVFCGGGCCCCSCCLHTLGGLIGVAIAVGNSDSRDDDRVIARYWAVLAVLTILFIFASLASGSLGFLAILLYLPLLQLVASILTCILVRASNTFPDKKTSLRTVGRITLWAFFGALAGLIIMIVGLQMLR
jgi:hypothetical protein